MCRREGSEDTAAPNNAALVAKHIPGAQVASIPGTEEVVWIEEPEPFVRAIETFLASVREEEAEMDRVLATVLFTDIVGSSEKAAELGDRAWKELAERHHAVVRSLLARYRGNGGGHFRRRILLILRRSGTSRAMCGSDPGGHEDTRFGGSGWTAYR